MTLLTTISNESINENLGKRWKAGDIYTWIGGVLISVNPFRGMSRCSLTASSLQHYPRSWHLHR